MQRLCNFYPAQKAPKLRQAFRKKPISFESLDYNFYRSFIEFLTFENVQERHHRNHCVFNGSDIGKEYSARTGGKISQSHRGRRGKRAKTKPSATALFQRK